MGRIRTAIVVSEFNKEITSRMLGFAINQTEKDDAVDAAITIGAIIRGETRHDSIVAENTARLIADLSLKYGKPVSLGISGPDMTIEQARARIEIVPTRAVDAAISMAKRIKKLRRERSSNTKKTVTIED